MAQLLEDSLFCEEFIQQCPAAVEVLNLVAQECSAGKYLSLSFLPCFIELCQHFYHLIMDVNYFHIHSEQLSSEHIYHDLLSFQT